MSFTPQDDFKEQVRAKTNIVDLVSQTRPVIPKRGGREFVALCPFHEDHNPSMTINPERQTFRCWVCNEGGDCFTYVSKLENVPFIDALKMLAEQAGLEMPKSYSGQLPTGKNKAQMYAACQWARDQFHQCLLSSPDAEAAREYLHDRGISEESWMKFHLGFHPDDWSWLIRRAEGKFSLDVLEDARLVSKRTDKPGYYDYFFGRLIFPIHDLSNRCVAYGGRILPGANTQNQSKYWNSPESVIFQKSQLAFALNIARDAIKRSGKVLVMEGYTDCIVADQFGLDYVVATLGTALADSHVSLLKRFCQQVILVYDGDTPGQNAAEKALIRFVEQDVDLRILTLPEGLDPADFLKSRGMEEFQKLAETAPDALAFKLDLLIGKHGLSSEFSRQSILTDMLSLLKSIPRSVPKPQEDRILHRLASRLGIREETVRAELRGAKKTLHKQTLRNQERQELSRSDIPEDPLAIERLEQKETFERIKSGKAGKDCRLLCEVLQIMLAAPQTIKLFTVNLTSDEIEEYDLQTLFQACVDYSHLSSDQFTKSLLEHLGESLSGQLAHWLLEMAEAKFVKDRVQAELSDAVLPEHSMLNTLSSALHLRRQARLQIPHHPMTPSPSQTPLDEQALEMLRKASEFHRQRADQKKSSV